MDDRILRIQNSNLEDHPNQGPTANSMTLNSQHNQSNHPNQKSQSAHHPQRRQLPNCRRDKQEVYQRRQQDQLLGSFNTQDHKRSRPQPPKQDFAFKPVLNSKKFVTNHNVGAMGSTMVANRP